MASYSVAISRAGADSARPFVISALSVACAAGVLAGWIPLRLSIAIVFLFAGPHNWMEARYFVSRMPVRWAASRNYFLTAIAGVVVLLAIYGAIPLVARVAGWSEGTWTIAAAGWNSVLILWISALVFLRGRQRPGRDWSIILPIGFALVSLNWILPQFFEVALIYLHPLIALLFLDRQIRRSRPEWLRVYRMCLCAVPAVLVLLWIRLVTAAPLPDDNGLALRIAQHAGADFLNRVPSQLLVGTQVYLETIHYAVWIVALPLIGLSTAPWRTDRIPLVRHKLGWPKTVNAALLLGIVAVVVLWVAFATNYSTTRDIYFTFAMGHVLAEVPFLLRMF